MPDDDNELREAKARVLALADGCGLPVNVGIGRVGDGCGLVIKAPADQLDALRDLLASEDVTVPFELRRTVALTARRPGSPPAGADPAAPGPDPAPRDS